MGEPARNGRDHLVGGALAHGTVRHARLAETAPAGATAQDLYAQAILNDLHIRHDGLGHRVGSAEVLHHALIHDLGHVLARARNRVAMLRTGLVMTNLVEGGNIDAPDFRELAQHLGARHVRVPQLSMALAELDDLLLALADHHV